MKRLIVVLFAFLAIFVVAGCSNSAKENSSEKVTISSMPEIEGLTYYGQVPQSPKRVVSLTSTYTGYLLKLEQNLVGVTSYDKKNPVLKDSVKDAKEVAATDIETIQSLEPDLIVVGSTEENIEQLAEIAPLISLEYRARDYLQIHTDLGKIFNKEKEAQTWVDEWKKQTDEVGQELKTVTGEEVTFTVMGLFQKEIYLFGDDWGRGGEVIYQALGYTAPQKVLEDVFPDGYLSVSQEAIADYMGDYVIVAAEDEDTGSSLYESDLWKSIPAVQNKRVIKVDANAFYFNDPMTLEYELEILREAILSMS